MQERGMGWGTPIDIQTQEISRPQLNLFKGLDSTHIQHSKPLSAVVAENLPNWRKIGAAPVVLEWIEKGVSFPITHPIPNFFHKPLPHEPEALAYWTQKLKPHYLASGAIVQIPPPTASKQFVSKCFFVPKSSGGFRLVVDLKYINTFFEG